MDSLLSLLGLGAVEAGYAFAVVLIAGMVRGFSGFGMSAIMVLALALVLPPARVVPVAMLMEVAASLRMLPGTWRKVSWRLAGWLLLGSALGTPIGAYLLVHLPMPVMRTVLSIFVLAICTLLWRGFRLPGEPRPSWGLAVGLFSGTANGAASFGGQPNALFLLSTPLPPAAIRATLVFLAFCTDIYGTAIYEMNGLVDSEILWRAGLFLIPMAIGIAIGQRFFDAARPETFRRLAIALLTALALAGIVRTALG